VKQNKSTLILVSIFLVACGLFLIYRGLMSADNYQKFNATVKDKVISESAKYNNGKYYSLDITLVEKDKVYGIYLGTKDQADNNDLINKIIVGTNYTFYIDPSVAETLNETNLGIRIIELNGQTIYKENKITNFIGGGIFIALGVLTSMLFIYVKRKKNAL